MRGDDVGDVTRVAGLRDHELHLVGHLRVQLNVRRELPRHAARERAVAGHAACHLGDRRVADDEMWRRCCETLDAHSLLPLDERPHAAVGEPEELQNASHRAQRQDVVDARVVDERLALRGEDQGRLVRESAFDRAHRFVTADEEGRDHLGEDDQLPCGQERELRRAVARVTPTLRQVALRTCPPRSPASG